MGVRVLIVDDSALARTMLSNLLNAEPGIEVIGSASNGLQAIDSVKASRPDVVLMDVEMPVLDGAQATKKILDERWVPIILFSGTSERESQKVLDGISAGAVDYVVKSRELNKESIREIVMKIKIAAVSHQAKHLAPIGAKISYSFAPAHKAGKKIILIGASTGGPQAIERVLSELPKNTPAPILIVQHMPEMFTKVFAERLDKICDVRVKEACEGDRLEDGVALIAPGGYHMVLQDNSSGEQFIHLTQEPQELGVRPCVNHLFRSVAPIYKDNIIAVVLTGMGKDGTDGAKHIKAEHGTVLVESETSCTIYGMPKEVFNAGCADAVIDLDKMAVAVLQLLDL